MIYLVHGTRADLLTARLGSAYGLQISAAIQHHKASARSRFSSSCSLCQSCTGPVHCTGPVWLSLLSLLLQCFEKPAAVSGSGPVQGAHPSPTCNSCKAAALAGNDFTMPASSSWDTQGQGGTEKSSKGLSKRKRRGENKE